jgi:glycosyltransferase involved in cell wall biosynthesis
MVINNPRITIVMPTYNRADIISRAIDSVLGQAFNDFELIIVDDASTDNTEDVVNEYADHRLIYVKLRENNGANVARNRAIDMSRGEYISFLDSDDEYHPDMLDTCIRAFEGLDNDVGVVYSKVLVVDESSRRFFLDEGPSGYIYEKLILGNCVPINSALVRRQCLETERFDESLKKHQEWDLWLRIARKYKFVYIDKVLAIWYREKGRERINSQLSNILSGNRSMLSKYFDDFCKHPVKLASLLYDIGHTYCKLYDIGEGRKYLSSAVNQQPYNIKYMASYLLSYGGATCYNKAWDLNNTIKRLLINATI